MHRDLLSFYSGYFRAALNGGFAEAGSGIVKLEIEEPDVFEGFVQWIYTTKARTDEITKQNESEYFSSIVKLWIFADRRDIPLLMNEMVDSSQQSMLTAWILPESTIAEIYNNTAEGSGLRRVIVHMFSSLSGDNVAANMQYDSQAYVQNFVIDFVKSLIANNTRKPVLTREQYREVEMCPSFHVHEEGVKCTKKGAKRSSDELED